MNKKDEIKTLQSLKGGGTYFGQLFSDDQIDQMCENITNDYPIEFGLNIFENSSVAKEIDLKNKLFAEYQDRMESAAKDVLIMAAQYSDDVLEDLAKRLVGRNKCLLLKLRSALPLREDDRDILINLLTQ